MHASADVPFVSLTRSLNVRAVVEARARAAQAPGWAAIFVKAFALVAKTEPTLRTLHVKLPWPCLYELPRSVGMVAIARVRKARTAYCSSASAPPTRWHSAMSTR